jgi:uncharacterized cupin superfamily protein
MSIEASKVPVSVVAADVAPPVRQSGYPEPFAAMVSGRVKRRLGDVFGLKNFGVNLTRLQPGSISALRHAHAIQDEFIYVLEGEVILLTDAGDAALGAGHCAGFRAGGASHQIVNRSESVAVYLEIGDRLPHDVVTYPKDDLKALNGADGAWRFVHRDGSPY